MTPLNTKPPFRSRLFPPLAIGFLAYIVAYSPWADKLLGSKAAAEPLSTAYAEADRGPQAFLVSRPAGAELFAGAERKPIGKAPQALPGAKAGEAIEITARFADGNEVTQTVTPTEAAVGAIFLQSEAKPPKADEDDSKADEDDGEEVAAAAEKSDTEEDDGEAAEAANAAEAARAAKAAEATEAAIAAKAAEAAKAAKAAKAANAAAAASKSIAKKKHRDRRPKRERPKKEKAETTREGTIDPFQ